MTHKLQLPTRSTTGRRRHVRIAALCSAIGLVALLGTSLASATTVGSHSQKSSQTSATKAVKPDLAYFAGKTITWIVNNTVGGTYWINATNVAAGMASYLHATINVVSNAAGGGFTGPDIVAASTPNGLTIGTMSLLSNILADTDNQANVNFSLQKVGIIAGFHQSPSIFVACTGYQNQFTSFLQVTKDRTPLNVVAQPGSLQEHIGVELDVYGVPAKLLLGYSAAPLVVAGCLRGDGAFTQEADSNYTVQEFTSGVIRPLLLSSPETPASAYYAVTRGVPTLAQFMKAHPPKGDRAKKALSLINHLFGLVGPQQTVFDAVGTPAKYTAALVKAFQWADAQPATRAALVAAGNTPGNITPENVFKFLKTAIGDQKLASYYVQLPQNN